MTLEMLMRKLEPRQKLFIPALVLGTVIGCASGSSIPNEMEGQGGAAEADQNGGAAGLGGMGGSGSNEEKCSPNASFTCHNGDAYWQNSCGEVGELYQACSEKQICENGKCVYDCSAVTPTSGCPEQNCSLYDTFDYGTCKWDVKAGAPSTSGEKLHLIGNSLVETKSSFALSPACNGNFIAQYKAELLDADTQGSLKISHRNQNPNLSGITITHYPTGYPTGENNKIILDCNGNEATVGDLNLHAEKTLKVHKIRNILALYIDNVLATTVLCSSEEPTPVYAMTVIAGSAVLPQAMKLDDITLYCSSD